MWLPFPTDHVFHSEGGHPAGHWLHRGQPELQARARRAYAGLLCRGEHLLPQVGLAPMPPNSSPNRHSVVIQNSLVFSELPSLLQITFTGICLTLRSDLVSIGY